jgi:hypothetical protein
MKIESNYIGDATEYNRPKVKELIARLTSQKGRNIEL